MSLGMTDGDQARGNINKKEGKRDKPKVPLAAMEKKVVWLELVVGDWQDQFGEISQSMEGLDVGLKDVKNGTLLVLNAIIDTQ
ncbi:hypothetical protein AMTR_s00012p00208000 [Amborella trichopoda]|uniref:Uncharacterized protein n=1 Tax=Amborella trichopoda TaxID=13333 RepID=W1PD59_AMBTC|nr:hypothetical protein AMTR_s00012p00208000 [Amborella trichopoda]